MNTRFLRTAVGVAALATTVIAQAPTFRMDPAVRLGPAGGTLAFDLTAVQGTVYATLGNLDGGPTDLLGERFYLGFSPTLVTLDAGVMPAGGVAAGQILIPAFAGALGLAVFGQCAVLDASAPNGLFRTTNAESGVAHGSPFAIAVKFDDPAAAGFTGSYSQSVVGHIAGGPVTRRTHETIDPQGVFFPIALNNPLNPHGSRKQMVFRAQDVGATGNAEIVTAIRWYSLGPVFNDSFAQLELLVGHTPVTPDYAVDPWTALPVAPSSGLASTFASNYGGAAPQTIYNGRYDLVPAMRRPDGYVPLPVLAPFRYDGASSLLVEFKLPPDPLANGFNGMFGAVMVQSSPNPAARNTAGGTPSSPVNPYAVTTGQGDNWLAQLQLEFTRVETDALSPWLDSGNGAPDYEAPGIAASLPAGTGVQVEYRGAATGSGANPTAWSASPDIADGYRFLQFRIVFVANAISGEVPLVDTLVVPFK